MVNTRRYSIHDGKLQNIYRYAYKKKTSGRSETKKMTLTVFFSFFSTENFYKANDDEWSSKHTESGIYDQERGTM